MLFTLVPFCFFISELTTWSHPPFIDENFNESGFPDRKPPFQWEGVTSNLEYDWLMSSTSVGLSSLWRHLRVVFAFAQPFIIYSLNSNENSNCDILVNLYPISMFGGSFCRKLKRESGGAIRFCVPVILLLWDLKNLKESHSRKMLYLGCYLSRDSYKKENWSPVSILKGFSWNVVIWFPVGAQLWKMEGLQRIVLVLRYVKKQIILHF